MLAAPQSTAAEFVPANKDGTPLVCYPAIAYTFAAALS